LQFYPQVLLSLLPGPRKNLPVMLGEFNDFDTYRNIHEMYKSLPFWAADSEHLNARGVRWQYDLPRLKNHRLAQPEAQEENERLRKISIEKGAYVRRKVMESVRSHGEIAGYAITGWRDTPISSSGLFDDEMNQVFKTEDIHAWNQPNMLFLIPTRRPPWQRGGNRPGYLDPQCYFAGQIYVKVGVSSERGEFGDLHWKIDGVSAEFGSPLEVEPLDPLEVGVVSCDIEKPGEYKLNAEFGSVSASWPIWVVERPHWESYKNWRNMSRAKHLTLPGGDNIVSHFLWPEVVESLTKGNNAVIYMDRDGTKVMPFWRECVVDFKGDLLKDFEGHWERLYSIAPDCALDEEWLEKHFDEYEVVMNRIDTRTYQEHPLAVRARLGKGWAYITTLRPRGKLGSQPQSFSFNPAGAHLLKTLIEGF
ncbi:MAG: hypothetical protein ACOCX1_01415, partial [Fimbriimonadaceae bacterium]